MDSENTAKGVAASQSNTERETIGLHDTVSQVAKLIGILNDRLNPVLKPELDSVENLDQEEKSLPPLANSIYQSRRVAQGCLGKLQSILSRLDV
jgi:hypothetical protein